MPNDTRQQRQIRKWLKRLTLARNLLDQQIVEVEEYYASHWRDDDSPQAEKTFGVRGDRMTFWTNGRSLQERVFDAAVSEV